MNQAKDNPILLRAAKGKYQNVVGLMTRKIVFILQYLNQHLIQIELYVFWIVLWSKLLKKLL